MSTCDNTPVDSDTIESAEVVFVKDGIDGLKEQLGFQKRESNMCGDDRVEDLDFNDAV